MRPLLFSAVIVGAGWVTLTPAMATSIGLTGFNGLTPSATPIQKVGYWKRQYPSWLSRTLCLLSARIRLLSASHSVRLSASCLWLPAPPACLCLFSTGVWP